MQGPNLVKAVLALLFVPSLALAQATAAPKAPVKKGIVIERVAAVVNDAVILESEVAQKAAALLQEQEQAADPKKRDQMWRQAVRQTVEQMVDEELVSQAAAEAKLEVTEAEVNRAVDEIKRQNKVTDSQLEQALKAQGMTMGEYKRDVKKQILRMRAVSVLVRQRVQVSDADVKGRYDRISGQSNTVTEIRVRHMLVGLPDKATAEQEKDAQRRASDLVARARGGEDFAALAKANSDDPATKNGGGDLGWYKRGELPTEWEEVLFAMAENEVRGPIRGPRGLHVFQVIELKRESARPFDEIKDQLREQLFGEEMEKQTKVWVDELRRKAHVEVKL
jgi:peptidyl-prolyl cis-trans isomerase SurA